MTAKTELPPVPAALADVALIDGPTCAAAAGASLSTWHELVRLHEAPQPVIRGPRCTRWRMVDVRTWLIQRAQQPVDEAAAAAVTAKATKASRKAQEPAAVAKARATRAARMAARAGGAAA